MKPKGARGGNHYQKPQRVVEIVVVVVVADPQSKHNPSGEGSFQKNTATASSGPARGNK